jgi:hypothetical protein
MTDYRRCMMRLTKRIERLEAMINSLSSKATERMAAKSLTLDAAYAALQLALSGRPPAMQQPTDAHAKLLAILDRQAARLAPAADET